MKSNKKYFNRVYSFFEHKMTNLEKLHFMKELETNAELNKEYEIQKKMFKFLKNSNK